MLNPQKKDCCLCEQRAKERMLMDGTFFNFFLERSSSVWFLEGRKVPHFQKIHTFFPTLQDCKSVFKWKTWAKGCWWTELFSFLFGKKFIHVKNLEECLPRHFVNNFPFHNCQKWSAHHPLSNRIYTLLMHKTQQIHSNWIQYNVKYGSTQETKILCCCGSF